MIEPLKLDKTVIVLAGTNAIQEQLIPIGKKIVVHTFKGSAPGSSKSRVVLLWGGVEKWVIQNDQDMPNENSFEGIGDGVKKITLCLSNGCTGDYGMTGLVRGDLADV